ncbi:hypothetical protein Aduo_014632 [Ancylostoma duodenale]
MPLPRVLPSFMWIIGVLTLVLHGDAEPCENSDQRNKIMWYFDRMEHTCFAYPVDCETPYKINSKLYLTEEECTLKEMPFAWRRFTVSCPFYLQLAVFKRSNGDPVAYIFSPYLCRRSNGVLKSDICTTSEYCYRHEKFAFCCNNRAFVGDAPVRGQFNVSGIGGPEKHIVNASIYSPPPKVPVDCNTKGERKGIEWYPHTGMACLARRSDCETPGFPVEETKSTYPTQQECMDAHFANWRMSYKMNCMEGFSPITIDDVPLVFSKTLCDSPHHSDMCNRDEYCVFSNRTKYGFCCYRSQANSAISYTIYGKNFRHQRRSRETKFVEI